MMRIALHGYARVGKDAVGNILVRRYGCERRAFGDIIKADLDAEIRAQYGFSAFTEDDFQKAKIRPRLVQYGYDQYQSIEERFFASLPEKCVNTRIFRPRECELWRKAGGIVWWVWRPGTEPAEAKEGQELDLCVQAGLIDHVLLNTGTLEQLVEEVDAAVSQHFPEVGYEQGV